MRRINRTIDFVTMLSGLFIAVGTHGFSGCNRNNASEAGRSCRDDHLGRRRVCRSFWRRRSSSALLWAANRSPNTKASVSVAPLLAAAFATLVVWGQQQAIWTTSVGFVFVSLIGAIAISASAGFLKSLRPPA